MNRRQFLAASIASVGSMYCLPQLRAAGIEAVAGKDYRLDKSRGPWMITAATFTTNANAEKEGGKTKEEAEKLARELILELRQLGMPAYFHQFDPGETKTLVEDRLGRSEERVNKKHYTSTAVMCGNYSDINDVRTQESLKWVKQFNPKCFKEQDVFRKTPGRQTPLAGAFITQNPLLSDAEVQQMKSERVDEVLVNLNHGENFSLFENKGQYSLIVARFYGKQMVVQTKGTDPGGLNFLASKDDVDLDNAIDAARELVAVLRGNYDKTPTAFNKVDAYIWHDYYESLVTVGSFSSENDPAVKAFKQRFGPKLKNFENGATNMQPESLGVQGFGANKNETRLWVFEPNPTLMRVPRLKNRS